jgi:hypothetical protein
MTCLVAEWRKPRHDFRKAAGESGMRGRVARQEIDLANWLESARRWLDSSSARSLAIAGHWGGRLRVFSNPPGCVMLGNETLDYFRFAIGP